MWKEDSVQLLALPIGPWILLPSLCPSHQPAELRSPLCFSLPPHFIISPSFLLTSSLSLSLFVFVSPSPSLLPFGILCLDRGWLIDSPFFFFFLLLHPCPLSTFPFPPSHPPRPSWPAAALMVVSRVGPGGLVEVEDSSGPAWTAVWAAYTTVFIPLSNSLYSTKALQFFFWVSSLEVVEEDRCVLAR